MAVDERERRRLYARLEQVLGDDEARILMDLVPPVGWPEIATKRDIAELRAAMKGDMRSYVRP